MHHSKHIYHDNEHELHGYLAYIEKDEQPKPAVLIAHDWSGQTEFFQQKAPSEVVHFEMGPLILKVNF